MAGFTAPVLLPGVVFLVVLAGCAHSAGTNASEERQPSPAVTADDIQRNPGQPIEQQLMSRFPGIVVTRIGGGIAIRVRGATSIHGNDQPLYVIDGVPIEPGTDGTLFGVNPYEIESIEVLKERRQHDHVRPERRQRGHRHRDEATGVTVRLTIFVRSALARNRALADERDELGYNA